MTARDLTPIEAAVLRMLAKPSPIQVDDIRADFCTSVDWDAITEHMAQPQ